MPDIFHFFFGSLEFFFLWVALFLNILVVFGSRCLGTFLCFGMFFAVKYSCFLFLFIGGCFSLLEVMFF